MFKSNFLQRKMDILWVYDLKNCDRKLYKHKKTVISQTFQFKGLGSIKLCKLLTQNAVFVISHILFFFHVYTFVLRVRTPTEGANKISLTLYLIVCLHVYVYAMYLKYNSK